MPSMPSMPSNFYAHMGKISHVKFVVIENLIERKRARARTNMDGMDGMDGISLIINNLKK
jgi:hypothetical protein